MPQQRRLIEMAIALMALCAWAGVTPARAAGPVYISAPEGLAVGGYDVVSYFGPTGPKRGEESYAVMWKGAVWLFLSRANLALFEANPRAYAPRFGGHCAYGVAMGGAYRGSPIAFEISGGQLYLFHNEQVQSIWAQDHIAFIESAETFWPDVLQR